MVDQKLIAKAIDYYQLKQKEEKLPQRELNDKRFALANGRFPKKTHVPKGLWDHHHAIVRRLVLGQKTGDIAKSLGCKREEVSRVKNDPLVRARLNQLHAKADEDVINISKKIKELAPEALNTLNELMASTGTSPAVRSTIARDLLDRGGYAAPKQLQVASLSLTSADLNEIKNRAASSGFVSRKEEATEEAATSSEVIDL